MNSLLQRDLELNKEREVDRYLLSVCRIILNLETKLAHLEAANEKLADALERSEDISSAEEFQRILALLLYSLGLIQAHPKNDCILKKLLVNFII